MLKHVSVSISIVFVFFALALVSACGGGSQAAEEGTTPEPLADEPIMDEPVEEEEEPVAEPAGPAPVQVTLEVKVGDRTVPVDVELVGPDGEPVAGRGGTTVSVVPGEAYVATLSIEDESIMIGGAGMQFEVVAPSEAGATFSIRVPVARVRLNVRRRGRAIANPNVTLFAEGGADPIATFRAGRDHVSIRPGRYEADVEAGQNRVRVRGLTFMEGATQDVPVEIQ